MLTPFLKTFLWPKQLFDAKILIKHYHLSVFQKLQHSDTCSQVKSCTKHGRPNQFQRKLTVASTGFRKVRVWWVTLRKPIGLNHKLLNTATFVLYVHCYYNECNGHYGWMSQLQTYITDFIKTKIKTIILINQSLDVRLAWRTKDTIFTWYWGFATLLYML